MRVPCFIRDVEFAYLGVDDVLQGEPVLASGCVGVELEECVAVLPRAEDSVLEGLEFIIEGFEFVGWGNPVGSVVLYLIRFPVDGFTHGVHLPPRVSYCITKLLNMQYGYSSCKLLILQVLLHAS